MTERTRDVCVVGAGPAGLTAGLYTARAGLDTLAVNTGESILRRNAHLENVPGFPAGVNSRLFLDMLEDQADRNGCDRRETQVTAVNNSFGDRLTVETDDGSIRTNYVICTSWAETEYLALDAVGITTRGSKRYIDVNNRGETGVNGLYAAGRVAGEPHQTVVAAGHGAKVGLSVIHDSEVPFYHDWVTPDGYFTDRDREVPPGCEEIDEAERQRREHESMRVMREYFDDPHPDEPTQHPSVSRN
jgi:thioredoxin reductase